MHPHELDQLVQAITDLVMARLKSMALPPDRTQTLTVLWPVASAARDRILEAVSAFRQEGRRVQWLVRADLIHELLATLSFAGSGARSSHPGKLAQFRCVVARGRPF
jgi:hypothetical protein